MTLTAPYKQLQDYIAAKTKQSLTLTPVGEKQIKISLTKKILIKEINIAITIRIEKIEPEGIVLSYQAPLGLDLVVTGAISYLTGKLPELAPGIKMSDDHRIRINLAKIKKAENIVDKISLQDITFAPTDARIEFILKS